MGWKAGKKKMDTVVESAIGLEENSCTSHGTMTSQVSIGKEWDTQAWS